MAKLRDLVACLAREMDLPARSMNVLAMALRKAGLIRTAGRGPNAAGMGPSDATNLILAALCGSYATQSASAVRAIRAGASTSCRSEWGEADPPPIPVYERLPWPHTLGDFLDGYIDDHVTYGDVPLYDVCVTNMYFSLERYELGWIAVIWIDGGAGTGWTIRYLCQCPDLAEASDLQRLDVAGVLINSSGGARRTTTEKVEGNLFFQSSLCLRDEYGLDEPEFGDRPSLH